MKGKRDLSERGREGGKANGRSVVKIDKNGKVVEVYYSAREAGRKNFLSHQTIVARCNGERKRLFAPDGYMYCWDNRKSIKVSR